MTKPELVLASSSPYRKSLLERLGMPFDCASPDIDETPRPNEKAEALALRLAVAKARALEHQYPGRIIIGSDQVAALPDGSLLNKPGSHEQAQQQLSEQRKMRSFPDWARGTRHSHRRTGKLLRNLYRSFPQSEPAGDQQLLA